MPLLQESSGDSRRASAAQSGLASAGEQSQSQRRLCDEIARRRTFAIISHPDAGKTTLTEKFLLYAGQVSEAGAVRGRKTQRAVTSDWMKLERERGISISSTVLSFGYQGHQLNLLDTPGHDDFSEDTYRTLTAADCAVLVIDAVKGIESQTRKLFKVCAERKIPIITFMNKMDRPGCEPLATLSEIEQVLGIHAVPFNWPIGTGRDFRGVYDRQTEKFLLFKTVPHGSIRVPTQSVPLDELAQTIPQEEVQRLMEEIELIREAGAVFNRSEFLSGGMSPVFFGSALTNFGVEPFLSAFVELSPAPRPRQSDRGEIAPDSANFSGVVFKVQANLDLRHHDRVAFLRVCSGRFVREMELFNARTGSKLRIKRSHRAFAQERETVDEAFAGDVVGIVLPGQLRLGDTLYEGSRVEYEGRWHFPPECFAVLRCIDVQRRKQFTEGLAQLSSEGAVQLFHDGGASREPIIGAVGELQFDVVRFRLETEYKTQTEIRHLSHKVIRWVTGDAVDIAKMALPSAARRLRDQHGRDVVVFETHWAADYCTSLNPRLTFDEGSAPMGQA